MKYRIKYNYDTGDTFSTDEGIERYLELEWDNIEIATANLKRIEEHYEQYKRLNSYSNGKTYKDIFGENQHKDWYVNEYPEYSLKLYTDEGTPWQLWAPWCGYFETLNFAEVEEQKNPLRYTP